MKAKSPQHSTTLTLAAEHPTAVFVIFLGSDYLWDKKRQPFHVQEVPALWHTQCHNGAHCEVRNLLVSLNSCSVSATLGTASCVLLFRLFRLFILLLQKLDCSAG